MIKEIAIIRIKEPETSEEPRQWQCGLDPEVMTKQYVFVSFSHSRLE
jgi:hypothetical protein